MIGQRIRSRRLPPSSTGPCPLRRRTLRGISVTQIRARKHVAHDLIASQQDQGGHPHIEAGLSILQWQCLTEAIPVRKTTSDRNGGTASGMRASRIVFSADCRLWSGPARCPFTPHAGRCKVTGMLLIGGTFHQCGTRGTLANFKRPTSTVPGLVKTALIPNAEHWVQQERPTEVSAELLAFLKHVHR